MSTFPDPNVKAARALGSALRRVGYSESAVTEMLGDDAYGAGPEDVPVHVRRLPTTRLAIVVRALFLGLPVETGDAVRALGRRGVDALETTGLAEVEDEVVPRARVLPVGDLLIAADTFSRGADDPPDYVAGYTPTSRVCDSLTPRRSVARALDVGTGSGSHALLAAGHAQHVVATDVNPRALAFTQLNAALNELTNIECRAGSLFEPAGDERFDLITCNAPYVVSPERRWAYRDAGGEADEVSERVVLEAAAHLAEGGFATVVVSWVADDADAPDERVLAWTEATGCDGWILVASDADPLEHAAEWNSHLSDDPDAFGAAIDEWMGYLDRLGVRRISDGAVVLHRGTGRRHPTRVDSIDEEELDDAGEQILRAFAARERLSQLGRNDLLDARISLAAEIRLEHDLEPRRRGAAQVVLSEGTNSVVETTPRALEILAALDGSASLRNVVDAAARRLRLSEREASWLRRDALELSRELLELGALSI